MTYQDFHARKISGYELYNPLTKEEGLKEHF
jgi:hypothetical protein